MPAAIDDPFDDPFDDSVDDPSGLARTLRAWAATNRRYAETLVDTDPAWGSETFDLAGGVVALHGPGLYVNTACAVGIETPLTEADLDELERRCADVGVEPSVEVTPLTHPDTVAALLRRGYARDDEVVAFRLALSDRADAGTAPDWLAIEAVGDDADRIRVWQEAAALGWGHSEPSRRRASDAFGAVAAIVDDPGLLLAVDRVDGAVVGCASLSIVDGVATLGGMSTVPAARRRGVQAALIEHRLDLAAHLGAELAVSTTVPDGASQRNLERHGFAPWCRVVGHSRP